MNRITSDDTASIFIGSGALNYGWYNVIEFSGIDYVDKSEDDWRVVVTVPDYDDEKHTIDHAILMRAVRRIARKEGRDIPHLSPDVRYECLSLVFGRADDVDFDADFADQVIQVALFGKIVFG